MPEGVLGGILGEEEESPEPESAGSSTGSLAFAMALAAKLSANDPAVSIKTQEFLNDQSQLLRLQKKHLEAEHADRLATLAGQRREGYLRRVGIRIRIVFQLFAAMAAVAIASGLMILVHDAVISREVVIEPFHAPPDFLSRGIDGTVIASGVLDELTHLQMATRSASVALGASGAWGSNIKLEVPETGISISDLSHALRERFGHDVHIDGDLVETPVSGLALTVRGNGVPPRTFAGTASQLDQLKVDAAEYVYSKSQPVRWAQYLFDAGRNEEALEFCRTAVVGADALTHAQLLNDWGNAVLATGGSNDEALLLYREAVKLKPDLLRSYANLMNTYLAMGNEEEAWNVGDLLEKTAKRYGGATGWLFVNMDLISWNLQPWLDAVLADAAASAGMGTTVASAGQVIADVQERMHNSDAANLELKTIREDPRDPTIAAIAHFVRGRLAADAGNVAGALTELEAFSRAYQNPAVATGYPGYQCWVAPAEEAAGHPDKADALLNAAGTYVDCYRFRGDVLDGRHDWAGAQKAYADAVALAPHLPASYYSWGLALVRHGELDAGIAQFKEANKRGPHWADPLKAWGDVLMMQSHREEALAKYRDALRYAPFWVGLKQASESAGKITK